MKPLLLEIGCEEIPARFVRGGVESLKEELLKLLKKSSIEYGDTHEYSTPRRLTVLIKEVAEMQKDIRKEIFGPPIKVAFDTSGNPTKAAIGFSKSLNMDVSELKRTQTERGEYVSALVEEKGKPTQEVLSEAFPILIKSLQFPKSMRWGYSSIRFFRPIHWILALLGNEVVSFSIDNITSGTFSFGHRFLSPSKIQITSPDMYLSLLKQNHVLADASERKNIILDGINNIESSLKCIVNKDGYLLDIVTNLVEFPTVIQGSFDKQFLSLPSELLTTVMKTHQKYFSVQDENGNMLHYFIVVGNTDGSNNETVRRGAERVLRARLEDAKFYFKEDQEIPLSEHIPKLKKVTFQEKLGNLHEKAQRIFSLSLYLGEKIDFNEKNKLEKTAMLSKADLVTGVVGEFPELQGYMGKIYAANSGEEKDVSLAIYEHYLPKSAGDVLPTSKLGTIISLADKVDNITSFFSINLIPTGSEDPFALRRQASGVLSILLNSDYNISLNELIENALLILRVKPDDRTLLSESILQFFKTRLESIFSQQGYGYDIIESVLAAGDMVLCNIRRRIDVLKSFKQDSNFSSLLISAKRVYNILTNTQPHSVNLSLLKEPAEKELFKSVINVEEKLESSDFRALFELEVPINTFFDNILVMDKDQSIKENRLALLFYVKHVFNCLGDFSMLTE